MHASIDTFLVCVYVHVFVYVCAHACVCVCINTLYFTFQTSSSKRDEQKIPHNSKLAVNDSYINIYNLCLFIYLFIYLFILLMLVWALKFTI